MDDLDNFAQIHIDDPKRTGGQHESASVPPREPEESFWRNMLSAVRSLRQPKADPEVARRVAPSENERYRMVPMPEVLDALKISAPTEGNYLDDTTQTSLNVRLNRNGLGTATVITGPLRLRSTDLLPIVRTEEPVPSRASSITLCLYLIAWMLEADGATPRDLSLADAWIEYYDPKEKWAPAAQGMLRWLLSRKLFMTHKRKQRAAKLKRFQNVRAKLQSLLLHLVADPEYASPKRMKRLATVYEAIGLNPADIHGDIHRLTTTSALPAPSQKNPGTEINKAKLQEMQQNTRKAQQILSGIFAEEEPEQKTEESSTENNTVKALRELAGREEWSTAEVNELAKRYGSTSGALLEQLNDIAYEVADDSVADDDGDKIYINAEVAALILKHLKQTKDE